MDGNKKWCWEKILYCLIVLVTQILVRMEITLMRRHLKKVGVDEELSLGLQVLES